MKNENKTTDFAASFDRQYMTCVVSERKGHFYHFGIQPVTASLYGHKPEEIITVSLRISKDQIQREQAKDVADYWGWFDAERGEFVHVYPSLLQLKVCSPDFWARWIREGRGQMYRLEVEKTDV